MKQIALVQAAKLSFDRLTTTLMACLVVSTASFQVFAVDGVPTPQLVPTNQQLIVLFDQTLPGIPSVAQIVAAVGDNTRNPALVTELGVPSKAGRVLENITSPEQRSDSGARRIRAGRD